MKQPGEALRLVLALASDGSRSFSGKSQRLTRVLDHAQLTLRAGLTSAGNTFYGPTLPTCVISGNGNYSSLP
jgi:hypothetical protein